MNTEATPRPSTAWRTALAVTGLVAAALLGTLVLQGVIGAPGVAVADAHASHATPVRGAVPASQVVLRQNMRALWEEHITWTRMAIVEFAADSPALPAATARLLRNQTDIGNAIVPFYGRAAGTKLTRLLRSHILIAVDVLTAAKAGDQAALAGAQAAWTKNADQIADFLSAANPAAWPKAEMRQMMRGHLRLTTGEAVARLTGDWAGDVRAYDAVHRQALAMADMLSSGIIAQFPARLR